MLHITSFVMRYEQTCCEAKPIHWKWTFMRLHLHMYMYVCQLLILVFNIYKNIIELTLHSNGKKAFVSLKYLRANARLGFVHI